MTMTAEDKVELLAQLKAVVDSVEANKLNALSLVARIEDGRDCGKVTCDGTHAVVINLTPATKKDMACMVQTMDMALEQILLAYVQAHRNGQVAGKDQGATH